VVTVKVGVPEVVVDAGLQVAVAFGIALASTISETEPVSPRGIATKGKEVSPPPALTVCDSVEFTNQKSGVSTANSHAVAGLDPGAAKTESESCPVRDFQPLKTSMVCPLGTGTIKFEAALAFHQVLELEFNVLANVLQSCVKKLSRKTS
jgi:hypothetical protein